MRRARVTALTALALVAVLLVAPATALGHAQVTATTPESGAELESAPDAVSITFNEPVEASFGALRVYDSEGERVESGELYRPGEDSEAIAIGLEPGLADGGYTATYRVVSADSHPISGGFAFTVGAGTAPQSVSDLLERSEAPPATGVAFTIVRWVGYLALGLAAGGLCFLIGVWSRTRTRLEGLGGIDAADTSLRAALRRMIVTSAALGAIAAALSIPLQGSTAAGVSALAALDPDVIRGVLETRFGSMAIVRLVAWLAVLAIVLAPAAWHALGRTRAGARARPALLGSGVVPPAAAGPALAGGAVAAALLALFLAPGLAGHAAAVGPGWLLIPSDAAHLLAMSVWFGGLACLALVLPRATSRLRGPDKGPALAATLARFSPLALLSVLVLVATGTVQSIVLLDRPADIVETGFGRTLLAKALGLSILVAIGAWHRRRSMPELDRAVSAREPTGANGVAIRRAVRAEVALVAAVLALSAVLVSLAPAGAGQGPASGDTELGDALLEWTVDPGAPGQNRMHLYLFDSETGEQLDGTPAPRVVIELPDREIGPLEVDLERAGPGHYVAPAAPFGVAGEWTAEVELRTSRFEQDSTEFEVPIR